MRAGLSIVLIVAVAQVIAGCGKAGHASTDGGGGRREAGAEGEAGSPDDAIDAAVDSDDAAVDAPDVAGDTAATSDAADLGDAIDAPPSVSQNPPVPPGWKLMSQEEITPEITAWAAAILHDPAGYPMFATATMTFGTLMALARVEWLPPDFQDGSVHRGLTLYEPV